MGLQGLTDKVAVVVGGATGIGAATAARLGGEGCRVVIGDIAEDAARQTAERIAAAGGTATHVAFDLADPDSVAELIHTAATTYDGVDLLFNVGADMSTIRADTDVVDIEFDVWDRVMTVNLRGYVAAMKYAIPRMLESRRRGDRQHVLGGGVPGRARATGLCHRQGRHRRAHPARRVAVGKGRHPV